MPKFGDRLRRGLTTEEQPLGAIDQTPDQRLVDAEAALHTLLGEQATVHQTLQEHQQQRHELLRDGDDLQRVTDLDRDDYQLRLRLEQIGLQIPTRQAAVQQAQAAAHETAWQAYRPVLVEAEQRTAAAIGELYAALAQLRDVHNGAHRRGFAGTASSARAWRMR
jgi:hypothetical protein